MHKVFVRAIITGFGFTLGSALFKKVAKQLGLDDTQPESPPPSNPPGDDDAVV